VTTGRLRHVEIWSDFQCAGGARLAILAGMQTLLERRDLTGDDELTIAIPPFVPGSEHLAHRRVIRVVDEDDDFDEWRLAKSANTRQTRGVRTLSAVSPMRELTDRAVVVRIDGDGTVVQTFEALGLTVAQHLSDFILPSLADAGQAWWTAGTIEFTGILPSFVYDWSTPMDALRRIAEDSRAASGLPFELRIDRVGTSGYAISLVEQIGADADVVDVRVGKNLLGDDRVVGSDNQATRIYPRGAEHQGIRADLRGAEWLIADITGNVVTLQDPQGGAGPVGFDGQLTGMLLQGPTGTPKGVMDSEYPGTVTLDSVSGLAEGDRVTFLAGSGTTVQYLDHPVHAAPGASGVKIMVMDRPDIPTTKNLVPNPAARAWPGGNPLPIDWTKSLSGVTVTRELSPAYTKFGGQSMHVVTTVQGLGVVTLPFPIRPNSRDPYFSGFASLWVKSGRVRIELWFADASDITTIRPSGTDAVATTGDQVDTWIEIGVANIDALKLNSVVAAIAILQDGPDPAEFYLDGVQMTQTIGQRPFLEGNGANLLWQAANERLALYAPPSVELAADLIDVHRADPALFPYDQIRLGGRIATSDPEMGVRIETRLVGYTRDWLKRLTTRVQMSNLPTDLTDALVRPVRTPAIQRRSDTSIELSLQAYWTPEPEPSTVRVRLAAQPEDAVIRYILLDELDPVPPMGDAAWQLYTGARTVTADDALIKLVAYAQIGERKSRVQTWMIDADRSASLIQVTSENLTGGQVRLNWVPDIDTVRVDIYRMRNGAGAGYPTSDGSADATKLLPANRIASKAVETLGTSQFPMGTQVMGGTTLTESGFANGDVIGWALVPFDRQGRAGTVVFHTLTLSAVLSPGLTAVTFTQIFPGFPDVGRITWAANGSVTSAMKLRFTLVAGGNEYPMGTFTNPLSPTQRDLEMVFNHSDGKNAPMVHFRWRVELLDAANVVLASYLTGALSDTVEEDL
jgi:hypothetical protein